MKNSNLNLINKKTKVTIVLRARYGKPEQMMMLS
jgi:hypothetical protein